MLDALIHNEFFQGFMCCLNLMLVVNHYRREWRRRWEFKKGECVKINALGKKEHLELVELHGHEFEVEDPLDGWVQLKVPTLPFLPNRFFLVKAKCLTRVKKPVTPQEQPASDKPSP